MKRTQTKHQQTLELPLPKAATFGFFAPDTIEIAVPAGSLWHMPAHWHTKKLDVQKLLCTDGHVFITTNPKSHWRSISHAFGTGLEQEFDLSQMVSWGTSASEGDAPATVILTANEILHRNICSAILDKDIYPYLDSTPLWLKAYFRLLERFPARRQRLLDRILYIQMQVTYYGSDYHLPHGSITIPRPWRILDFERPPEWILNFQTRSMHWISRIVMMSWFWTGRMFLGMKMCYPEYTPDGCRECC